MGGSLSPLGGCNQSGMCYYTTAVCQTRNPDDIAGFPKASGNDNNNDAESQRSRICHRVSAAPMMRELVGVDQAFSIDSNVKFSAARMAIMESFHDWLESAVWICYQATGIDDDQNLLVPEEIRGPERVKEIIAEVLELNTEKERDTRLRAWLTPKSTAKASTRANIHRRLNVEDFAPVAAIRFFQYERLLQLFDASDKKLSQAWDVPVAPYQVDMCAKLLQLMNESDVSFSSFSISLASNMKELFNCGIINIMLIYETEDQLWKVYGDRGSDEMHPISTSVYSDIIATGETILETNRLVVPAMCVNSAGSQECYALIEVLDKAAGDGGDRSTPNQNSTSFNELDRHFLTLFIEFLSHKLQEARDATKESPSPEDFAQPDRKLCRKLSLTMLPVTTEHELAFDCSRESSDDGYAIRTYARSPQSELNN
eukprot:GEMP01024345.1.p1 GENE.GEMP01024345.1~~GEMP01024345.1.p1  ORF type:complete len:428 (+),score=86.53 GEMP01024345.1:268-1551(+)